MCFLLKICVLLIFIVECMMGEHQCLPSNRNIGKCQDWREMSVLVADLVGRSATNDNDKVKIKSNILTLLIRSASGVIGRGADTLKTLIVNGLVLLTQTILTVSEYDTSIQNTDLKAMFVPGSHGQPIDWIMNNPYIKSMMDDATDEMLSDRLEKLVSGMPCVQLLVCRLTPFIQNMQRRVKDRMREPHVSPVWNVSDWQRVKSIAKYCVEKHYDCAKSIKLNSS